MIGLALAARKIERLRDEIAENELWMATAREAMEKNGSTGEQASGKNERKHKSY
jgi:hypothetical protein